MKPILLFNFFDPMDSLSKLAQLYNLDFEILKSTIEKNSYNISADYLINKYCISDRIKPTYDIFIVIKHLTTFDDSGASIKKLGILSLDKLLSTTNPLNKFFAENNISIDISSHSIIVNGELYKFRQNRFKADASNYLYHRLISHRGETEGFIFGSDDLIYSYSVIKDYPEIVCYVDKFLISKDINLRLRNRWALNKMKTSAILRLEIPIDWVRTWGSSDDDKYKPQSKERVRAKNQYIIQKTIDCVLANNKPECYVQILVNAIPSEYISFQ